METKKIIGILKVSNVDTFNINIEILKKNNINDIILYSKNLNHLELYIPIIKLVIESNYINN